METVVHLTHALVMKDGRDPHAIKVRQSDECFHYYKLLKENKKIMYKLGVGLTEFFFFLEIDNSFGICSHDISGFLCYKAPHT